MNTVVNLSLRSFYVAFLFVWHLVMALSLSLYQVSDLLFLFVYIFSAKQRLFCPPVLNPPIQLWEILHPIHVEPQVSEVVLVLFFLSFLHLYPLDYYFFRIYYGYCFYVAYYSSRRIGYHSF